MSGYFLPKRKILYIDDIRENPYQGADTARNYDEAVKLLSENKYDMVSFDHDLADVHYACGDNNIGDMEKTGYHIALWLLEHKLNGGYAPQFFRVHSMNPVGRQRIINTLINHLQLEV